MIKKVINLYKSLDNLTYKILKHGLQFCFCLCAISIFILITYELILVTPPLYYLGIALFKLSAIWSIEFIVCALVVDSIKKQLI